MLQRASVARVMASLLLIPCVSGPLAAQSPGDTPAADIATQYRIIDTGDMIPRYDRSGMPLPVVEKFNVRHHDGPYRTQTFEFNVPARSDVELMLYLDSGDVLIYSWQAQAPLHQDLHGHQSQVHPDIWVSYSADSRDQDHGSLVAGFEGEHGWLWTNTGNQPVRLDVTISGYYSGGYRTDRPDGEFP